MTPRLRARLRGAVAALAWVVAATTGCKKGGGETSSDSGSTPQDDGPRSDEGKDPGKPARGPFPPPDGTPPVVELDGVKLELNPEDRTLSATLWSEGTWEKTQTEQLLAQLSPGDTFVDVGANIGYYTVLAAHKVGPEGRVFAFEPDPESFALLQRNVERNGLSQVVLENKAAGAENGTLELFLSTANRGDHRIYDPGGGRPSVEVAVVRLDEYFAEAGGPLHAFKIDTRGAECAILAGMTSILKEHPELSLVVAYYPGFVRAMGYEPAECFGALAKHGFALRAIDDAAGAVEPTTVEALPPDDDGALLLPRRKAAG